MKNDEILHKWINNDLTKEELEVFKLRPEYPSLVELYKSTENLIVPDFDKETILADILKEKKKPTISQPKGRRFFLSSWIKYGVAASLLLFANWMFWPKANMVNYEITQGQKVEGTLPDQSTFVLNAESSLNYDADEWQSNRKLNLKGEAFFKVQKGETFEVVTPYGQVKVLGTQFNVFSRKGVLEVKCRSGRVAVLSKNNNTLTELTKGQVVRVKDNKIVDNWELNMADEMDWRDGVFRFKKVPLETVINELERQFEIKIKTQNINIEEILTCNFQNKDLDTALKTTISPLGLQYEIKDDASVLIYK